MINAIHRLIYRSMFRDVVFNEREFRVVAQMLDVVDVASDEIINGNYAMALPQ